MPYTINYNLTYEELNGELVEVNIYDTDSYTDDELAIIFSQALTGTERPLIISTVDNDRNKFKPIKGKRAEINIKSKNDGISARTFATGEDNRWYVEAHVQSTLYTLFKGFLVMDDIQEPFLPATTYSYKLVATDGLGILKTIPLTKPDSSNPRGYFKVIEYIAWILQKTGLELDIVVTDTWMEQSQSTLSPWYNSTYLHSKTFEKNIGESVDCYKALEMIFGFNCNIQQINGKWWISHIDERSENKTYRFLFNYLGVYQGQLSSENYQQTIGKNEVIKFINKDNNTTYIRPHKSVKLNFQYSYPKEIVDNIDFSRGDLSNNVSATFKRYNVDDWTLIKGDLVSTVAGTGTASIVREFINDQEDKRYLEINPSGVQHWLKSNSIEVSHQDRVGISIDFRIASNTTGNSLLVHGIYILLHGDDGVHYVFGGRSGSSSTASSLPGVPANLAVNDVPYGWRRYAGSDIRNWIYNRWRANDKDEREWQALSADIDPMPVGGKLYIFLTAPSGGLIYYNNLQFDYQPFINGTYAKHTGQSHKVSQSGNYRASIEEDVYIGDAPRKLMKGAMFKLVNSAYVLTQRWFASGDLLNQNIMIPPSADYFHPFGYLQVFAVWNQYNREFMELSGSAKGLKLGSYALNVPDLHDNYGINATPTSTKRFMPCDMSQEYRSDTMTITLIETVDTTIPKDYDSDHEFKYLV